MSKVVVVTDGQSLVDLALQMGGTVAVLFELADAAGLSITDALVAGQELAVPTAASGRPEVVSYFIGRRQRVNTGSELVAAVVAPTGDFDSAAFSNDFLIS